LTCPQIAELQPEIEAAKTGRIEVAKAVGRCDKDARIGFDLGEDFIDLRDQTYNWLNS
jgi:hypothetical protein